MGRRAGVWTEQDAHSQRYIEKTVAKTKQVQIIVERDESKKIFDELDEEQLLVKARTAVELMGLEATGHPSTMEFTSVRKLQDY